MSYEFINFAEQWGVEIKSLDVSTKVKRCGTTEHPRSKNGSYMFDGERGWVQAWDGDCEIHWWDDPNKSEPTQAERDDWARRKVARLVDQEKLWGDAAVKSRGLLDSCKLGEHNYLHRKGLGDVLGMVTPTDDLFVPMRNFNNEIVGGQRIYWEDMEWKKKYLYGSKPNGAVYRIGPQHATEMVLCEGYATGLSIDKALQSLRLKAAVLVCFNDSNMINIAKLAKGRCYVFADNDKSEAGEAAAQATGLNYCMSPVVGEDANDLHVRLGLTPLKNLIMTARKLKATA
jgi:putative DNA primase/helicase